MTLRAAARSDPKRAFEFPIRWQPRIREGTRNSAPEAAQRVQQRHHENLRADIAKWQSTACIPCRTNCGLHVQIEDGHFTKTKGAKTNPRPNGYPSQKPARPAP